MKSTFTRQRETANNLENLKVVKCILCMDSGNCAGSEKELKD